MYKTLFSMLLLACTLTSAQAETLSLREALIHGLNENYDLEIANLEVERAAAGIVGEEGRFDVTAELAVNASRDERPVASPEFTADTLTTEQSQAEAALSKQFSTGLQTRLAVTGTRSDADRLANQLDPAYRTAMVLDLTQPLLKDIGIDINTANLQIAKTRQQQAAYGYLADAQELTTEIEKAYLDLAQAEADYRYAVLARDLAKELLDGNQRKLDAGLVPVTEVNEARTAVASREETMLLSQQRITIARNRLIELINQGETKLSTDFDATLPEVSPLTVPLSDALETGLRQRPDLQQARLELDARKVALAYADNQLLPRLDLEASLGVNGLSGKSDMGSPYDGGWQDAFANDGESWYAGLRFSMPLQNRVAKAQYRDAEAQDQQALFRLRRAEIAAEAAIRAAHKTLRLGLERLEVARRTSALAQTTLDQETRRLQEGLSDTFRLLIIQNSLVTAKVSEVAALADYHRAWANLYQAMGTNLKHYNIVAALPHQGAMP
jgi:outer membrane protein TolC